MISSENVDNNCSNTSVCCALILMALRKCLRKNVPDETTIRIWWRYKQKNRLTKPFGTTFTKWWKGLQPSWRIQHDGMLCRDVPAGEHWLVLKKGGSAGVYTVDSVCGQWAWHWGMDSHQWSLLGSISDVWPFWDLCQAHAGGWDAGCTAKKEVSIMLYHISISKLICSLAVVVLNAIIFMPRTQY